MSRDEETTMYELRKDAEKELREWVDENWERGRGVNDNDLHEEITEIADSTVPIHNYDLIGAFQSDNSLWYAETELGEAKDVIQHIQYVIYEDIYNHLWSEWRTMKEEKEQEDTDYEEMIDEHWDWNDDASGCWVEMRDGTRTQVAGSPEARELAEKEWGSEVEAEDDR